VHGTRFRMERCFVFLVVVLFLFCGGHDIRFVSVSFNGNGGKYPTDVTYSVELAKIARLATDDDLHIGFDLINSHSGAPLYPKRGLWIRTTLQRSDLAPIYELFLWVLLGHRNRGCQIGSKKSVWLPKPHDTADLLGAVGMAVLSTMCIESGKAKDAVIQLDRSLSDATRWKFQQDGKITPAAGWDNSRRILNILWVRFLGNKHCNSLLFDLGSKLRQKDSKPPLSMDRTCRCLAEFKKIKTGNDKIPRAAHLV